MLQVKQSLFISLDTQLLLMTLFIIEGGGVQLKNNSAYEMGFGT
jgi:hypothetical protein